MSMTRTYQAIGATVLAFGSTFGGGVTMPKIVRIEGYMNGATSTTQYWLQIFNQSFASLSTGVTVPLRSLQILGTDGFTFNYQPAGLSLANLPGVLATIPPNANWIIALSTTDAVYTAPVVTCDINVEVEEFELEYQGTTTVTTAGGQTYLQVVADAANTNKLVAFYVLPVTNDCYVQLFANAPNASQVPIEQFTIPSVTNGKAPAGVVTTFKFGSGGKSVFQQDADGTKHYGIFIGVSLTSGAWDAATSATIQALYA